MTLGQRKILHIKPKYGYQHPLCQMSPPPNASEDEVLVFDVASGAVVQRRRHFFLWGSRHDGLQENSCGG